MLNGAIDKLTAGSTVNRVPEKPHQLLYLLYLRCCVAGNGAVAKVQQPNLHAVTFLHDGRVAWR